MIIFSEIVGLRILRKRSFYEVAIAFCEDEI